MVGLVTAKGLALSAGKPLIALNHLEGHALSPMLSEPDLAFPYLLLLVSGGHCQLLFVEGLGRYRRLATTIDDAAGEAFDKVARYLGLGYPGGPAIDRLAVTAWSARDSGRAGRGRIVVSAAAMRQLVAGATRSACTAGTSGGRRVISGDAERCVPDRIPAVLVDHFLRGFRVAHGDDARVGECHYVIGRIDRHGQTDAYAAFAGRLGQLLRCAGQEREALGQVA